MKKLLFFLIAFYLSLLVISCSGGGSSSSGESSASSGASSDSVNSVASPICPSSSTYTLDNSTAENSTLSDNSSITDNSYLDNSTVKQCSRIVSSTVDNSNIDNSTIDNSTIDNSTITDSTISNSNIDNSTISNATINNDNVTDQTTDGAVAPTESDSVPFDDGGSSQRPDISITFSESLDTSTVITNTGGDTSCSGSVMLSTDSNFGTCIAMDSPSFSNGNKTITVTPGGKLSCGTLVYYKIRTTVKDATGTYLSAPIVKSFEICD